MHTIALMQAQTPPGWLMFVPWALVIAIIWFLIIRPQQQQQRRHQDMLSALKQGTKVVTSGGLYGTVVEVRDKTVFIRIAEKVKVELLKSAVSAVQGESKDA